MMIENKSYSGKPKKRKLYRRIQAVFAFAAVLLICRVAGASSGFEITYSPPVPATNCNAADTISPTRSYCYYTSLMPNDTYTNDVTSEFNEISKYIKIPEKNKEVSLVPYAKKLLIGLPLFGRDNRMHVFFQPSSSIYETLLKRVSLKAVNKPAAITVVAGTITIDTHVHTHFSHDSMADTRQVLATAARRGLTGVAITDHDNLEGALNAVQVAAEMKAKHELPEDFVVIPGEEIATVEGHVIGLFLTKEIPPKMTVGQTIYAIHAQGGVAVAPHPLMPNDLGMEMTARLPFDAVETEDGAERLYFAMGRTSVQKEHADFYSSLKSTKIGCSDAHDPDAIGICYTRISTASNSLDKLKEAFMSGKVSPECGISDEKQASMLKHGMPLILKSYESISNQTPAIQSITHSKNFTLTVIPKISLQWKRYFK